MDFPVMHSEYYFVDDSYELVKRNDAIVILRKTDGKLFKVPEKEWHPNVKWAPLRACMSGTNFAISLVLLVFGTVAAFVILVTSHETRFPISREGIGVLLVLGVITVAVHEFGHMFVLQKYGRRPAGVGIKMNYFVFPAIYVRMNHVKLLAARDQFAVHVSGLLINYLMLFATYIVNAVWLQSANIQIGVLYLLLGVFCNSLPLLDSDGQKALFSVMGWDKPRTMRIAPKPVKIIDGVSWVVVIATCVSFLAPAIKLIGE